MAFLCEFYVESSVCGYHVHKETPVYIGEILECEIEVDNEHDIFAIIVKNYEEKPVGHVPIELSKTFHQYLSDFGEVEAECTGSRFNAGLGTGLELPVDYKFVGSERYLERVSTNLRKINEELNIKNIRKSELYFRYLN